MNDSSQSLYFELTETILGSCFDVMNEQRKVEYQRLHHPDHHAACDPVHLVHSG
jgi:hypothetical protein